MITLFDAQTSDEVLLCVRRGDNVNAKIRVQGRSKTPICIAAENNNVEVFYALIEHGANFEISNDFWGHDHPIVYAIKNGSTHIVKEYLTNKNLLFDVNMTTIMNSLTRPLSLAIISQYIDIIRLFIEFGARLNYVDMAIGMCPLSLACDLNNRDIVQILFDNKVNPNFPENTPPIFKVKSAEIFYLFFVHNANMNIKNRDGQTVLYNIVLRDIEFLKHVLELNVVDISSIDKNGMTVMEYYISNNNRRRIPDPDYNEKLLLLKDYQIPNV